MKNFLMGIDIGTSGLKVAVFDHDGNVVAKASHGYNVHYTKASYAEQDVEDWWAALKNALPEIFKTVQASDIAAIGIDGQSWSMIPVDKQGNTLMRNAIWQDTRSAEIIDELKETVDEREIFEICGNPLKPAYSTGKILWMKRYNPNAYRETYKILQSNSYLVYKLTGEFTQDESQGYGLHNFDMRIRRYDEKASAMLGLDIEKLPNIHACDEIVGTVSSSAASETGLTAGTRVVAGGLDAACGTLGVGVIHGGETQEQGGQAGGMSICLDEYAADSRLILSTHVIRNKWLLQGGTVGGGGALKWFEREFAGEERLLSDSLNMSSFNQLNSLAETAKAGCGGMIFLPYMQGERSPIWDVNAKGIFYGVDYSKTKAHFVRSVMEGVAFSLKHNLNVAKEIGIRTDKLFAMGGAANSLVWTQIKSDVTGREIIVPSADYATTLGAAMLAGVAVGAYSCYEEAVRRTVKFSRHHTPNRKNKDVYSANFKKYLKLYQLTKELNES